MATLGISLDGLKAEVGQYLGFGRDPDEFTDDQTDIAEGVIRSGLRQVYTPPLLQGQPTAHDWSFLKPVVHIAIKDGKVTYDLPEDFAGFEGKFTFVSTSTSYAQVPIVGEGLLRQHKSGSPTQSGEPSMVAARAKFHDGATEQGYELLVFPEPDADYVLEVKYRVLPQALSALRPYPYGGGVFAELLIASCLAVAEIRLNDVAGTQNAEFYKQLAAAISRDGRMQGENLGYNGDPSSATRRYTERLEHTVTIGGVTPT